MNTWVHALLEPEPVALMVLLVLLGSLIQGMRRGASGSARRLFFFIWQAAAVVLSLLLAGRAANWLSPVVKEWLIRSGIQVPQEELSSWKQLWYTMVTSLRDFELLRFGVLFLVCYLVFRTMLGWLEPVYGLVFHKLSDSREHPDGRGEKLFSKTASRTTG
ncbi:transglutaminase domain-containing protein, partial [Paenibacillus sepulcri]|nr:transglutaminase domain-containing protein [Paenibacillus sepulcri]